jgi:DNA-binding winged helix-turn-helix (wHTH) protein/predicted ATPase
MIRFGRYELDATQGLTRGGQEVRLTPRSLAVLGLLAERAGSVVTKDELFETVWADTAVTDSALATCIQEIRHVLDDDARRPRFIETLHRRGYRFVARTSTEPDPERAEPIVLPARETALIGRDADVQAVLRSYVAAQRGGRQVCFITGEPGVGKSALLNTCLRQISATGALATWGQCVERSGSGEPYQPLLDALMRLCRQASGGRIVSILERFAPMWLVQLPGLLDPRHLAALQRRLVGASRDRMLRELANAVEVISAHDPLVLAIEDLHWSDPSTLDWIAAVASRPEPAKLLIVATLRPIASGEQDGPLPVVFHTLRAKQLASEVALTGLDDQAVVQYVALRHPPAPGRADELEGLGRRLRHHTGGNPLFVATVLDQLVDRGVMVRDGDGWAAAVDAREADLGIPESIRPMLERQVLGLPADERVLLETASVVGDRFLVGVVAGVLDLGGDMAEATLRTPASQRFVHSSGDADLPDGTQTSELAFAHALYRDALYQHLPRGRRVELHRRVGEYLERAWGARSTELAAGLAVHFEHGRDFRRAVDYLHHAAENAKRRSAFREARAHYDRALALLDRLPESDERRERELSLRMGSGAAAMATSGWGAPDVEAAYRKARSLAHDIGDTPRAFPAIWGLWVFYWGRDDLATADELARDLRKLAGSAGDDAMRLEALHASWATAFSQGAFESASAFAAEGIDLYDAERHAPLAATYGNHDAGVCARLFASRAMAFAGRVDDAIRASDEAIALAATLDQPFSTALSLTFRAALDQACTDVPSAGAHAAGASAVAREQGFGLLLAWSSILEGWAAVQQGEHDRGILMIAHNIEATRRLGSGAFEPYLLGTLADANLSAGRVDEGLATVGEALSVARRTGDRFYEAELHRLNGELTLAGDGDPAQAAASFRQAIDVARGQGAAMLALRAAIRLAGLPVRPAAAAANRRLLRAARNAVPAELGIEEVAQADALLAPA